MSSPHSGSSDVPSHGRRIAPLPRRSRRSSNPGSSQNVLSTHGTPSQNPSSETNQSLSTSTGTSIRRRSYQTPDTTENAPHVSPPAPDVSRIAFQFGQSGSNSLSTKRQETYALPLLNNITPRPSLNQKRPLSASQDSSTGLNGSSLPTLSAPDHKISQPLHTMYSDEKIAIPAAGDPLEQGLPTIVGDHSDTGAGTYRSIRCPI